MANNNTIRNLRIGIPLIGVKQWLGGVTYVELLVKALSLLSDQERPKIYLVLTNPESLDLHRHIFPLVDGHIFFGWNSPQAAATLKQPVKLCRSYDELADYIDFYYPVNSDVLSDVCSGSWIPDFQHVHLPEFFPKEELTRRDGWFQKIASHAKIVVFSSRDSENDFRSLYPNSSVVTRVLHFYALPVEEWYKIDPAEIRKKYNLPDNFFICCNQFWAHKNHIRLFEALAKVRQTGRDVHLVCTGSVAEWRVRDYFHNLTELINSLNIKDCVHILGTIPRDDQIQLIRHSMAVIQPSLFEGWSTVVEDSRALGKTIILSDLPVHYEQAPDHSLYFDRNNPDDLAEKILSILPTLGPGPDASRERQAQIKAYGLVLNYAKEFCDIAVEAQSLCGKIILNDAGDSTGHILSPGKTDQVETLVQDNQRPDISLPSVTVATSIAPKNIDNQQAAVTSWLKLGFRVISVNTLEEINSLKEHFPEVTFIDAPKNAVNITGKPYIFFDDVLKALDASQSEICGIVNSDIHLIASDTFQEFISAEAKDSLIYGTRIEIESLDSLRGETYEWGFDYFFFDKSVIPLYPNAKFSIGAPWWDLWACFIPVIRNVCVKKLINPVAYHKIHPKNWSKEVWTIFFREFISHLSDKDVARNLPADFLEKTKSYIPQGKFVEFSGYVVTFIDQKVKKITLDNTKFHGKVPAGVVTLSNNVQNYKTAHTPGGSYPKISIVTPSLNQGQFLEECIDSILSQGYPNLEYIIMDGGSTDNSVEIIKKYGKYLKYWQSQPDGGQYNAINEGFKHTTGEIMAWLNSDDKYHPNALFKAAYIFETLKNTDWIIGRPSEWDKDGNLIAFVPFNPVWSRERYLQGNYYNPFIQQESTFWRRSLWEKAGGRLRVELDFAGDLELWVRFFRHAQLYSVQTLIGGFRRHVGQKTHTSILKYRQESVKVLNEEIEYYNKSMDKTLLPVAPVQKVPMEIFSDPNTIGADTISKTICWHNYINNLEVLKKSLATGKNQNVAHFVETELSLINKIGFADLQDKPLHISDHLSESPAIAMSKLVQDGRSGNQLGNALVVKGCLNDKFNRIHKEHCRFVGNDTFIVCAMFRPDKPLLLQYAKRLANSCKKYNLPYVIYEVPEIHKSISPADQEDPAYTKACLIYFNMMRFPSKNILYLDIDVFFVDRPTVIMKISKSDYDFAIYNWLNDKSNEAYLPVKDKAAEDDKSACYQFVHSIPYYSSDQLLCNGSVQFYRNSDKAKYLLECWQTILARYPDYPDDECLDYTFNNFLLDVKDFKPFWLEKSYIRYPWWPHIKPVILHPDLTNPTDKKHINELNNQKRFYPERCQPKSNDFIFPPDFIIDTDKQLLVKRGQQTVHTLPIKQKFWIYPINIGLSKM